MPTPTISGFAGGDIIDLAGVNPMSITSGGMVGNVLELTMSGGPVLSLTFDQAYAASFNGYGDGFGGTDITLPSTVTVTDRGYDFSHFMDDWFGGNANLVPNSNTPTGFSISNAPAGIRVDFSGSGLFYGSNGPPVAGTITSITGANTSTS